MRRTRKLDDSETAVGPKAVASAAPAGKRSKTAQAEEPEEDVAEDERFVDFSQWMKEDCKQVVDYFSRMKPLRDYKSSTVVFAKPLDVPQEVTIKHVLDRFHLSYKKNSLEQEEIHIRSPVFLFPEQCSKGWPLLQVQKEYGQKKGQEPTGVKKYIYEICRPINMEVLQESTGNPGDALACLQAYESYFKGVCRVSLQHYDRVISSITGKMKEKKEDQEAARRAMNGTIDALLANMSMHSSVGETEEEKEEDFGISTSMERLTDGLNNYFRKFSPFRVPEISPASEVLKRAIWAKRALGTLAANMKGKWLYEETLRHVALEREMEKLCSSGTLDETHLVWASSFLSLLYNLAGGPPDGRQTIMVETAEGAKEIPVLTAVYNALTVVQVYDKVENRGGKSVSRRVVRLVPPYELHFNPSIRAYKFHINGHFEVVFCGKYLSKKPTFKFVIDSVWLGTLVEEYLRGAPTEEMELDDDMPEFPGAVLTSVSASSSSSAEPVEQGTLDTAVEQDASSVRAEALSSSPRTPLADDVEAEEEEE